MVHRSVLLLLAFLAVAMSFGIFARPSAVSRDTVRQSKPKHGSLKLCPPEWNCTVGQGNGFQTSNMRTEAKVLQCGPSFLDAFNLICPMRRRRRSIDSVDDRSTLEKTMHKCCEEGCEFSDIFPICNPFG